jgi:hypothetical protein
MFKLLKLLFRVKLVFLVKYPTIKDLNDGYFQRVQRMDEVFVSLFRVYLNFDNSFQQIEYVWHNKLCVQINLSKNKLAHCLVAWLIAKSAKYIYTHSILRLEPKIARLCYKTATNAIFDIHGVVPEEFSYHGDDLSSGLYNDIERFAYENATIMIGVTKNMLEHVIGKYPDLERPKKVLVLPIMQKIDKNDGLVVHKFDQGDKPTVIYAGGTHKWQQFDKMMLYVMSNHELYNFIFLVPDVDYVAKYYSEISSGQIFPGILKSVAPSDVSLYYQQAQYGLVLREDVIVNRAACPTKLIEYMLNDIIPIVDSPEIGDFNKLGYRFIRYTQKISLSADEVNNYLHCNRLIISGLYDDYQKNVNDLLQVVRN